MTTAARIALAACLLGALAAPAAASPRSLRGDTPVTLEIVNRSTMTVDVYWLDYQGQEKYYATVAPGGRHRQGTYATHPWLLKDRGRPFAIHTATSAPYQIFDVPPEAAPVRPRGHGARCQDAVQDRIAWDYRGSTHWDPANVERLCRGGRGSEPARCFEGAMHGGVYRGDDSRWHWQDALALCSGSRDAAATLACFQGRVAYGVPASAATASCGDTRVGYQPPTPAPPEQVSWAEARRLIYAGRVDTVAQTHRGEVSLRLHDGRWVHTREPYLDAVLHDVAACGTRCSGVGRITE